MQWNVKDKGLIAIILILGRGGGGGGDDKSISNHDFPRDPRFISFQCAFVFLVLERTVYFTGSARQQFYGIRCTTQAGSSA